MSRRIFTYSFSNFSASVRCGSGNRRARSAVVPIALASLKIASRRASKRDKAIAKVKAIISANNPDHGTLERGKVFILKFRYVVAVPTGSVCAKQTPYLDSGQDHGKADEKCCQK